MDTNYLDNKNAMYQFPTQHHYPHHLYSQCHSNIDHTKLQNLNSAGPEVKFTSYIPQNVLLEDHMQLSEPIKSSEVESTEVIEKKKRAPRKPRVEKAKGDETKKKDKSVDTSTFTIEERLVAAVWIHERHHTHHTITEIKAKFLSRFNREPPSKTTLFAWERKLFATGNVCDAPRPGRPEKRKSHVCEVADSLKSAPALSLRARAQALRLPRTTLHNIMRKDLPADTHKGKPTDKPPPKRRVKQPPRKTAGGGAGVAPPPVAVPAPAPAALAPAPPPHHTTAPAHTHMHYMMHAIHSHNHPYS